MPKSGDAVYRRLMDLALLLQDDEAMAFLKMFLGSITDDINALRKLRAEVEAFISRIETLVEDSRGDNGHA